MTDPTASADGAEATPPSRKRAGGLNGMLLAELKSLAAGLGVAGAGSMKKAQLVEAIKAAQGGQGGQGGPARRAGGEAPAASAERSAERDASAQAPAEPAARRDREPEQRAEQPRDQKPDQKPDQKSEQQADQKPTQQQRPAKQNQNQKQQNQNQQGGQGKGQQQNQQNQQNQQGKNQGQHQQPKDAQDQVEGADADGDGDEEGRGRSRRRRGRDRERNRVPGQQRHDPDPLILDDDVLVPAAGILDVLDNYAFVRTSGYLPGSDDVYLSLTMVRKYGLRRGDAIAGQVRQPRDGERREKFNPMVRIDAVNGADPESARNRVEFSKLTPLHPQERLRLETGPEDAVGRVIDLVAPLGKGQRGLIVSPPSAGKTTILQSIANALTRNNPECHLMVVLVDERPEEVTDFQRSVKGEVVASTFDRPPADHTVLAELAIERAKRLVELGHDVVVLLDGITRLGRAYNLAAVAGGRTLAGGVDSGALFPTKRFFGAARNIENGGSLTVVATIQTDTGSATDELILEEFTGTENQVLRLRAELAAAGLYPAVDVAASGTRKPELLLGAPELAVVEGLRAVLPDEPLAALEDLLRRVVGTRTNIELLTAVQRGQ